MASDLLERYLPEYDVSDSVACVVAADLGTTWDALVDADLIEVGRKHPLVAVLGFARMLPEFAAHLLHGERMPDQPERLRLKETTELSVSQGGWVLLGERAERRARSRSGWQVLAAGDRVRRRSRPSGFRDFSEPGWAKTVYDLGSAGSMDGGRCSPPRCARRRPTTAPGAGSGATGRWELDSGAHVLVDGLFDSVRDRAEAVAAEPLGAGV